MIGVTHCTDNAFPVKFPSKIYKVNNGIPHPEEIRGLFQKIFRFLTYISDLIIIRFRGVHLIRTNWAGDI